MSRDPSSVQSRYVFEPLIQAGNPSEKNDKGFFAVIGEFFNRILKIQQMHQKSDPTEVAVKINYSPSSANKNDPDPYNDGFTKLPTPTGLAITTSIIINGFSGSFSENDPKFIKAWMIDDRMKHIFLWLHHLSTGAAACMLEPLLPDYLNGNDEYSHKNNALRNDLESAHKNSLIAIYHILAYNFLWQEGGCNVMSTLAERADNNDDMVRFFKEFHKDSSDQFYRLVHKMKDSKDKTNNALVRCIEQSGYSKKDKLRLTGAMHTLTDLVSDHKHSPQYRATEFITNLLELSQNGRLVDEKVIVKQLFDTPYRGLSDLVAADPKAWLHKFVKHLLLVLHAVKDSQTNLEIIDETFSDVDSSELEAAVKSASDVPLISQLYQFLLRLFHEDINDVDQAVTEIVDKLHEKINAPKVALSLSDEPSQVSSELPITDDVRLDATTVIINIIDMQAAFYLEDKLNEVEKIFNDFEQIKTYSQQIVKQADVSMQENGEATKLANLVEAARQFNTDSSLDEQSVVKRISSCKASIKPTLRMRSRFAQSLEKAVDSAVDEQNHYSILLDKYDQHEKRVKQDISTKRKAQAQHNKKSQRRKIARYVVFGALVVLGAAAVAVATVATFGLIHLAWLAPVAGIVLKAGAGVAVTGLAGATLNDKPRRQRIANAFRTIGEAFRHVFSFEWCHRRAASPTPAPQAQFVAVTERLDPLGGVEAAARSEQRFPTKFMSEIAGRASAPPSLFTQVDAADHDSQHHDNPQMAALTSETGPGLFAGIEAAGRVRSNSVPVTDSELDQAPNVSFNS